MQPALDFGLYGSQAAHHSNPSWTGLNIARTLGIKMYLLISLTKCAKPLLFYQKLPIKSCQICLPICQPMFSFSGKPQLIQLGSLRTLLTKYPALKSTIKTVDPNPHCFVIKKPTQFAFHSASCCSPSLPAERPGIYSAASSEGKPFISPGLSPRTNGC